MTLTPSQVKSRIDRILRQYQSAGGAPSSLLPPALTAGKLYEAWVLCSILDRFRLAEGYSVLLRQATRISLKSSPGPINRAYPFFELAALNRPTVEVWTDVEFMALSHAQRSHGAFPTLGDYHELDIVAVPIGTNGRPRNDNILLGVECKNTGYSKDLLRGVLGVRRELSLLSDPIATHFLSWPRSTVPADPPSCLMVYSTDPAVMRYASPGDMFGIDFVHDPLP